MNFQSTQYMMTKKEQDKQNRNGMAGGRQGESSETGLYQQQTVSEMRPDLGEKLPLDVQTWLKLGEMSHPAWKTMLSGYSECD